MRRNRVLFYNTLLLTATNIIMRVIGLTFQVYLSGKIGSAGLGLFQLISSVSVFAQTVAISGIRFTTTRLVAEEMGTGSPGGARRVVRRCLCYAGVMGTASAAALFIFASYIGKNVIGDTRTVLSLKILAVSLPWMSMGTVFAGYFTAVCRVMKAASAQFVEQIIRIVTVAFALAAAKPGDLSQMCAAVVFGGITGETLSFFFSLILYLRDIKRYKRSAPAGEKITSRMFSIAVPLALSAYARTALVSVQNILIPRGLKKSGASKDAALSGYGMIQGMVFPVITFPAAFFMSLSELIVPYLTSAQVKGRNEYIKRTSNRLIRLCLIFSIGVMSALIEFSGELGTVIYKSGEIGELIKVFAFLMPIMYLDTVTDGMLRGLGQHMYSMYFNIADSVLCLLLVVTVLPRYAIFGYMVILYVSEIFNFALSIGRLGKVTKLYFEPFVIIKSLVAAAGAVAASKVICRMSGVGCASIPALALACFMSAVIYIVLLFALKTLPEEDIAWIKRVFSKEII